MYYARYEPFPDFKCFLETFHNNDIRNSELLRCTPIDSLTPARRPCYVATLDALFQGCREAALTLLIRARTTLKSGAKNVGMLVISGQKMAKLRELGAHALRFLFSKYLDISILLKSRPRRFELLTF